MKEAIVFKDAHVELRNVPIPVPTADQVLIQVVVSGSNPKDWKIPRLSPALNGTNSGDDIAGIVTAVGDNVTQFKPGDRVAGFHEMTTTAGSYAEYAISSEHATFHIPKGTSFEEAATIPLAAMTAALGLFVRLGLPEPWKSTEQRRSHIGADAGIVVYGGASAVGAFAIKLAKKADIHPIIAIAGRGIPFVKTLLDESKGDVVIDYRKGDDFVVEGIREAVPKGKELRYAFDAVSEKGSWPNICKVLSPTGNIVLVLPGKKFPGIPEGVSQTITMVGDSYGSQREFALAWYRLFALGLKDGWFSGHPYQIMPGGLGGLEQAMRNLKGGKASAVKYVFRIGDTEGAGKETPKL